MRNLKRALSLALATVMTLGLMVVGTGASYADVSSEHNQEAIDVLQTVGIKASFSVARTYASRMPFQSKVVLSSASLKSPFGFQSVHWLSLIHI